MTNKTSIKISLVFNLVIAALTIMTSVFMFTGFRFMSGEVLLESSKLSMFKFFTVDSNILMGIVAILFAVYEILLLKGKITEIPKWIYVTKLAGTSAVTLTFAVVFLYLGFLVKGGVVVLLLNNNLFFHLIIPVLSILVFVLFERTDKIKFKHMFFGALPAAIYAVFYTTNVLTHLENGQVSHVYDFYYFVQGGLWQIAIVVPVLMGVAFGISVLLWAANKKRKKKQEE